MIKYKLTSQNLQSFGGFQWEMGVKKTTNGKGDLCGPGWLHCYSNPLLATLLNPIHTNIQDPKLFEVEVGGENKNDYGLKEGWTEMTLIKEISFPDITPVQKIAFAILCSLEIYKEEKYVEWANNWLNNIDRVSEYVFSDNPLHAAYHANQAVKVFNRDIDCVFGMSPLCYIHVSNAAFFYAYSDNADLIFMAEKAWGSTWI